MEKIGVYAVYAYYKKECILYETYDDRFETLDQDSEMQNVFGLSKSIISTVTKFYKTEMKESAFYLHCDGFVANIMPMNDFKLVLASAEKIAIGFQESNLLNREFVALKKDKNLYNTENDHIEVLRADDKKRFLKDILQCIR